MCCYEQKLFSSVPKREYAIKDINLTLGQKKDDGIILLVGRSASGKSTILRLIAGMEMPTQGSVSINGNKITQLLDGDAKGVGSRMPSWIKVGKIPQSGEKSQPVILDGKPDFDDSLTVMQWILKMSPGDNVAQLELLANDFVNLLGLDEQCSLLPSELSPSEQYLFCIACGCMVSVAPAINEHNNDNGSGIPYPILLFDELFDTEVPSTVEKCNKGITNLIECGAVVISATHRPNYFVGMSKRIITLSGGKVLTDVSTS